MVSFFAFSRPLRVLFLLGSGSLLGTILSASAQGFPATPVVTFSPAVPISTEPITIIFTSSQPNGYIFNVTLNGANIPHSYISSCTGTQKNGVASCSFGRILPGYYDVTLGDGLIPTFSVNIAPPGNNTVSALQGQYAFFLNSPSKGNGTALTAGAAAGSFTADGTGKVTAGVVDINYPGAAFRNLPLTGTYQLNSVGQGTISLKTTQGILSLAVKVPTAQTVSNVVSGNLVAVPGSLVGGGGTLVNQSGIFPSTTPVNPGFAPYLSDSYSSTLIGENSPAPAALGGAAQFTFTHSGSLTCTGHFTINGAPVDFAGLQGAYSSIESTTGRAVMTFGAPGQPSLTYALYETSQQSFNFLSLDPHAAAPLIAGTAQANQ